MNGKPSKESQSLISELEEATLGDVSIKTVVPDDNENDAFSDDDEDLDDKFLKAENAGLGEHADDFDEEIPAEEVPEESLQEPDYEETKKPVQVTQRHRRQAKTWLRTFNVLSRVILKFGYKEKFLEPGDTKKLKEFKRTNRFSGAKDFEEAITEDKEIWGVIERYEIFNKVCADISLDEDEYKEGLEIISEVIAENPKLQVGPGAQLLIWAGAVIGARAEPLIGVMDIFPGHESTQK